MHFRKKTMVLSKTLLLAHLAVTLGFLACQRANKADLILKNGRVYSYTWSDPAADGTPAPDAPFRDGTWVPDAEAIAIRADKIIFVGNDAQAESYASAGTRVLDMHGGTVLPGLVDSHVHIANLGAKLERVDLTSARDEAEAVARVAARAATVPDGEWIIGAGWDEGAWADRYPDMQMLTERVPNHPVFMQSLHSFAAWGNRMAFEKAGITAATPDPVGGEIRRDKKGNPTGLLLNRATNLLSGTISSASQEEIEKRVLLGLGEMAKSGFVAVHEAGASADLMAAFEQLDAAHKLPLRVYAMLSARDTLLLKSWRNRGPEIHDNGMLTTRAVKAFYDGALGSRGARLLTDYTDKPGYRGVSGDTYGFDRERVTEMMRAGFQVCVYAIGDAGNRETLDFFDEVFTKYPETRRDRHRIEHAQVVHPDDFARFAQLGLTASMEPEHAVEDKAWAEQRLGPERIKGAYAWRTMRESGVPLIFNSDLPGSDHNIFYGLHAAMTRRGKDKMPPQGWYPEQTLTAEEAIRAYSVWAARAAFIENETGRLQPGMWADISVLSLDPHNLTLRDAGTLLDGAVYLTVVGGKVIYENLAAQPLTVKQ